MVPSVEVPEIAKPIAEPIGTIVDSWNSPPPPKRSIVPRPSVDTSEPKPLPVKQPPKLSPQHADGRVKQSRTSVTSIAAAIAFLAIGYFVGREHLKYEMRTALRGAAESIRQSMAESFPQQSSPASGFTDDVLEPEQTQLKITSIDTRVTESNDIWSRFAWILKVENKGSSPVAIDAVIEFVDSDGFVIEEDRAYSLLAKPNQETEFTGYSLINSPVDKNVDGIKAQISLD
jgi:hypothetical protein